MDEPKKRPNYKPLRGTGDSGRSSLFTNEKRWKDDAIFEALGTTDELSSHLGVARVALSPLGMPQLSDLLVKVQCVLQDIGSHLATPTSTGSKSKIERAAFDHGFVSECNSLIDDYGNKMPPLKQFILPGGDNGSAQLHVARSVCRRLERRIATVVQADTQVDIAVMQYVNRLSDLLFVLARYVASLGGGEEISYKKPVSRQ